MREEGVQNTRTKFLEQAKNLNTKYLYLYSQNKKSATFSIPFSREEVLLVIVWRIVYFMNSGGRESQCQG